MKNLIKTTRPENSLKNSKSELSVIKNSLWHDYFLDNAEKDSSNGLETKNVYNVLSGFNLANCKDNKALVENNCNSGILELRLVRNEGNSIHITIKSLPI